MKRNVWLLPTLLILSGCATAPPVTVLQTCPVPPPLELDLPPDALERSFSERMRAFLSGSLGTPINYDLHFGNASSSTPKLNAQ